MLTVLLRLSFNEENSFPPAQPHSNSRKDIQLYGIWEKKCKSSYIKPNQASVNWKNIALRFLLTKQHSNGIII